MCNNIIRIISYNNGKETVTKIKIINIYHRVSKIHKKKKEKRKKCDSRFDFTASSNDSIVSPLWNVARLKIIETHTRGNSARKGGKEWSEVRIRSCAKKLHSCHALLSRRIEKGIYKMRTTSFDIFSMLVKFDSTCFVFFFFFKGENRLYLPFSFDDFAIKLNDGSRKKGNLDTLKIP